MKKKYHILIVEDDILTYNNISKKLKEKKFSVSEYLPDYDQALAAIQNQRPDLALLDINLQGDKTGIDLGKTLKDEYQIPFIFLTENDSDFNYFNAINHTEPDDFISKTDVLTDLDKLVRRIYTVINRNTKHSQTKRIGITGLTHFLQEKHASGNNTITEVPVKYENIVLFTLDYKDLKKNYICFLSDKNQTYFFNMSLNKIYNILPPNFVRINSRYIINLKSTYFKGKINGNKIQIGDKQIKITDTYKDEFQKRYQQYFLSL